MEEVNVYIGVKDCGCVPCIKVDVPDLKNDTAKEIGKWIKAGLKVECVSLEIGKTRFKFCHCEEQL